MRIRNKIFATVIVLGVASMPALAQEAPAPGPEHKRLGYFVGKWTSEGEMKANPFMPGGKFTNTDHCEWFEGGFAVVCHTEGSSPMGPGKSIGIMGYSTEEQAYTYYAVDNGPMAMASEPRGTLKDGTWTYHDEAKWNGAMVKSRFTIKELSPTSYTFEWAMVGEDGAWMVLMEGKATKSS